MDPSKLSTTKIDPTGKYILTSRCRTGRSVRGIRLPPAITFEERRKLEQIVTDALAELTGELKGEYFGEVPLDRSRPIIQFSFLTAVGVARVGVGGRETRASWACSRRRERSSPREHFERRQPP